MIAFQSVKRIVIPEGAVVSVSCAGKVLWQKVVLPSEYEALEYLESTGTQYVDTGIMLTSNHSVELDYQITASPQYRAGLFGGLFTNSIRYGSLLSPSNAALEHGYGPGNTYWQQGLPDLERHTFRQERNKLYIDGELVHTFAETTFSTTVTAKLGTFDYTNYKPALARYFRSRWWEGDKLVRDFLPCFRKSDGKPGMYDTVSKAFFVNAGTGEFVFDKPAYKRELAYLESTGNQYIDTGVFPTDSHGYEIELEQISYNGEQCPIGCMEAGNRFVGTYFGSRTTATTTTISKGWGSLVAMFTTKSWGLNQRIVSRCNFQNDRKMVFNGNEVSDLTDYKISGTISNSVHLFNRHYSSTAIFKGRLYYARISENNAIVRDFIPVLDWNDRPCMYDRVSGEFFYNIGGGAFTYGELSRLSDKLQEDKP